MKAGRWITKESDTCIQDQGTLFFLVGSKYMLRYLRWLEHNGYPMATGVARWMVELPVRISGISGRLQGYMIFGATLMLLGRPILEKLDMDVSFGNFRMRVLRGAW